MEENNNEFKEIKEEAKEEIKDEIKEDVLEQIEHTEEKKPEITTEPLKKPTIPEFKKPKFKFNWWVVGTVLFLVLFLASTFTGGFSSISGMSAAAAGERAINFLNQELLPPGTEASLIDIKPESGVYSLVLDIGGQQYTSYITRDGSLFFISGIEIGEIKEAEAETVESNVSPTTTGFDAPDTERPKVELYIMSFCPYGQQAEKNLAPVIELLGDYIDFEPHYIVSISDSTVNSLHGSKEADEDIRQACIWKYYPESWWDYVLYVDENIPLSNIEEKWTEAAETVGLDIESIQRCAEDEGFELMQAESALTDEKGITASPTLLINGERYRGQRTPEDFKQAICSAFEQPPDVCSEILEGSTAAQGNC